MAAGDAQRVWFPEMIERLRFQWHQGMSFDAIIELRDELDTKLQQIRSERHIRSPVFRCPWCRHVGEGAEPHVSVRAMILSLTRFGIARAVRDDGITSPVADEAKARAGSNRAVGSRSDPLC